MKKLLLAFALILLPSIAMAQCNGIFPASNVCGTTSSGPSIPGPLPLSSFALAPAGSSGQIQTNNGSGGFAAVPTPSGDCTFNTTTGVFVCTKTNGTLLANPGSATTDTTNATNIASGTLAAARLPSGVNSNVLSTQSLPFTITNGNTPCGTTLNIPGPGVLTLSAVGGFAANCVIQVCNSSSTRGITLSGWPTPSLSNIWQGQCEEVSIVNAAWKVTKYPGKYHGSLAFTINNSTGSDTTADGQGTGTGAFATWAHAVAIIYNETDATQGPPTIKFTDGQTFAECNVIAGDLGGGNFINLTTLSGSPSTTTILVPAGYPSTPSCSSGAIIQASDGGKVVIQNLTMSNQSGISGLLALYEHQSLAMDVLGGMTFGVFPGGYIMAGDHETSMGINSTFSLVGGAGTMAGFYNCQGACTFTMNGGTITGSGTMTMTTFINITGAGNTVTLNPGITFPVANLAITNACIINGPSAVLLNGNTIPGTNACVAGGNITHGGQAF